jgi:uncharacterized protein (TIGR00369 family)
VISSSHFISRPDPANPGWSTWDNADLSRFNPQVMGKLIVRREGERSCRLRMQTAHIHSNVLGKVHGGVSLALIDISLFACIRNVLDGDADGSVTLEITSQFIGAAETGAPLDAVTEVLKETRRLVFLRGLVEQDGALIAAFTGTVRKPSANR